MVRKRDNTLYRRVVVDVRRSDSENLVFRIVSVARRFTSKVHLALQPVLPVVRESGVIKKGIGNFDEVLIGVIVKSRYLPFGRDPSDYVVLTVVKKLRTIAVGILNSEAPKLVVIIKELPSPLGILFHAEDASIIQLPEFGVITFTSLFHHSTETVVGVLSDDARSRRCRVLGPRNFVLTVVLVGPYLTCGIGRTGQVALWAIAEADRTTRAIRNGT